jgi:hypothetical protein
MKKNKFNIPVVLNDSKKKKGNFIDHYKIDTLFYNPILKRRSISNINQIIPYGIELIIYGKK